MNRLPLGVLQNLRNGGFISAKEASYKVGLSVWTLYRYVNSKKVEGTKVGTKYFIKKKSLINYLGRRFCEKCGLVDEKVVSTKEEEVY